MDGCVLTLVIDGYIDAVVDEHYYSSVRYDFMHNQRFFLAVMCSTKPAFGVTECLYYHSLDWEHIFLIKLCYCFFKLTVVLHGKPLFFFFFWLTLNANYAGKKR